MNHKPASDAFRTIQAENKAHEGLHEATYL